MSCAVRYRFTKLKNSKNNAPLLFRFKASYRHRNCFQLSVATDDRDMLDCLQSAFPLKIRLVRISASAIAHQDVTLQ